MPDGVPHWDEAKIVEHVQCWTPPPPHGTYRQITVIEQTNDKEWMHKNMDLEDFGKAFNRQFEKLWQAMSMFAIGMVMMGILIWILK